MKTFNDILNELAEPKARKEKEFKDKHIVQKIDHPVTDMDALTAKSAKKDKTKKASLHDDEDEAVYEEKMSDSEMKKREDIVIGMKKSKADLKKRYGDRWKSVMYATATKNAMKEAVEVSHDRYMRSHGKKASGEHGLWMFTHKRMGDANVNDPKEVHSAQGKFSDAVKSAKAWAKKHGHSTAYVMEEVEQLDEIGDTPAGKKKLKNLIVNRTQKAVDAGASLERRPEKAAQYDKAQKRHMKTIGRAAERLAKEEVELDEDITKMSHSRLKWHMNTGVPHGSYTKDEMKKERDRRLSRVDTHAAYKKAKPMLEEVEQLDELSPNTLHSYIKKASGNLAGNAAVAATQASSSMKKSSPDVKRKMVNRMKGITGASGRLADKANMANEEYMDEAFKAGSMKLADGSSVKVTSEQANVLNSLFNELNSSNKKKMEERLMSSSKGFNEILSFAKEAL